MPISETEIIDTLKDIFGKYDQGQPEGSIFNLLKENCDLEAITRLSLNEINGWTLGSNPVLKHQRVEGLKTFLKPQSDSSNDFGPLLKVIEDLADFISDNQLIEDKLLKEKKNISRPDPPKRGGNLSKNLIGGIGILTATALLGFYIWLSNNRYQIVSAKNGLAYELDKKTGETWELIGDEKTLQFDPAELERQNELAEKQKEARIEAIQTKLPDEEQIKITGTAGLKPPNPDPSKGTNWEGLEDSSAYHDSWEFAGQVYNGSSWKITKIIFTIQINDEKGSLIWTRDYPAKVDVLPQQNSLFVVDIDRTHQKDVLKWSIKEVYGIQNSKDF
jgi:hypothetical protein